MTTSILPALLSLKLLCTYVHTYIQLVPKTITKISIHQFPIVQKAPETHTDACTALSSSASFFFFGLRGEGEEEWSKIFAN